MSNLCQYCATNIQQCVIWVVAVGESRPTPSYSMSQGHSSWLKSCDASQIIDYKMHVTSSIGYFFFCKGWSLLGTRTQEHWPIALSFSLKFIGLFGSPAPLPRATIPAQPRLWIYPSRAEGLHPYFLRHRHLRRICTDVSFSASDLLHEGVHVLNLRSIYCRLIGLVRSPINILQCFLFNLLINWTYLSVGPSRHN